MSPDLEIKLVAWINERLGTPFAWGTMDCQTFCLEAYDLLRGTDWAATVKGKYKTALGAARFWKRYGWDWITGAADTWAIRVRPGFEQTGDFMIIDGHPWQVPHVVVGRHAVTADHDLGVCKIHLRNLGTYEHVYRVA